MKRQNFPPQIPLSKLLIFQIFQSSFGKEEFQMEKVIFLKSPGNTTLPRSLAMLQCGNYYITNHEFHELVIHDDTPK